MTRWEELLAWVGFTEEDSRRLAAFGPVAEPELHRIAEHFYSAIAPIPEARAVFADDAQIERLKHTLVVWMRELFAGPHDEAYAAHRSRIGAVHVSVGLPERYVFAAMDLLRLDLFDLMFQNIPPEEIRPTCHALMRITDLELAVITGAYREAHEQQELRTLQDVIIGNMPVTVLCLDAVGHVNAATQPSTRLFATGEIGSHYEDFLPPDLVAAADLPRCLSRALSDGATVTVAHAVIGNKTTARHFRVTVVPLEHEMAAALIHVEELTDIVVAEARAQQAESLARIGRLSANVAHEIRNPLAAISATLQVIGGSLPGDDQRRGVLSKVQDQVIRLDRLVNNLLGYARPVSVSASPLDLRACAEEAISASGVPATLVGTGPVLAIGDLQYVCQILINLLQNARDVCPEGGVEVRVGPDARVVVADAGPGLDPSVAPRLFEPFVTSKARGTGLGLAISRKYADAMGGVLELLQDAEPLRDGRPVGAAFSLSLQASAAAAGSWH